MIKEQERERVKAAIPLLQQVGDDLRNRFMQRVTLARIGAGKDVMAEGDRVDAVPLLLSGSIRVYKIGESGREITLYRFGRGECCVLTADSILGSRLFPANAIVEEEAEVAFIPGADFDDWLARSPVWRQFVFEAMSKRLVSLMETLEDVAFRRVDVRVASLLLRQSSGTITILSTTHQEIADELGSSREVVSRILEDFRARGLIRLSRGQVEIIDPGSLATSALM